MELHQDVHPSHRGYNKCHLSYTTYVTQFCNILFQILLEKAEVRRLLKNIIRGNLNFVLRPCIKEIILNFFKIPSLTLEEWDRGPSYVLTWAPCAFPGKADTTPCNGLLTCLISIRLRSFKTITAVLVTVLFPVLSSMLETNWWSVFIIQMEECEHFENVILYGFSSGHVWMWQCNYKESWAPKNWCFWTVVLEKTLRVPWTARRSNQSILKEISPEYSL